MEKRDELAARFMEALIAGDLRIEIDDTERLARKAYAIADRFLAVQTKPPPLVAAK